MAVDMFLKLKGIDGESVDDKHTGEIDVLAWSWGASQSGSMHHGGGGGSGKANFQDISVTKWVDKGSHALLQACAKGTHIDDGVLVVRKAGDKPLEYLTIFFKEIIVTSYSTGGSGGEDKLTENVSLNFREFKLVYKGQKKDGSEDAAQEFAWNIAKNVAV